MGLTNLHPPGLRSALSPSPMGTVHSRLPTCTPLACLLHSVCGPLCANTGHPKPPTSSGTCFSLRTCPLAGIQLYPEGSLPACPGTWPALAWAPQRMAPRPVDCSGLLQWGLACTLGRGPCQVYPSMGTLPELTVSQRVPLTSHSYSPGIAYSFSVRKSSCLHRCVVSVSWWDPGWQSRRVSLGSYSQGVPANSASSIVWTFLLV